MCSRGGSRGRPGGLRRGRQRTEGELEHVLELRRPRGVAAQRAQRLHLGGPRARPGDCKFLSRVKTNLPIFANTFPLLEVRVLRFRSFNVGLNVCFQLAGQH